MEMKYIILWLASLVIVSWFFSCQFGEKTNRSGYDASAGDGSSIGYQKMDDNVDLENFHGLKSNTYKYNRQLPIIFVGGVPRSGTTLMRAMLDAHPAIRCGEETRIVPRVIYLKNQWSNSNKESMRLKNAGINDEIIDSAVASFILEVIVRHGKPAERLCNKDPLVLRYSNYVNRLFPKAKFLLMIRDGRASVHSMISRKVTISGFNLSSYRDCLTKWSSMIEAMYEQCLGLGEEYCMPVYYEQLVLHPESEMKKILEFLNITWNDAVLHHEEFIGGEISLSKVEKSSDQVIKPVNLEALSSWIDKIPADVVQDMDKIAPMLKKLGYDPNSQSVDQYGEADKKIQENTNNIKSNKDYWKKQAQKYSIHLQTNKAENNKNFD